MTLHAGISEPALRETTDRQRLDPGVIFRLCVGARGGNPNCGKITNFSPDKKFAVRVGYDPSLLPEGGDEIPAEATRKLEVIAMPGEEVVLDFSDSEGGLKGKVIWSQDSKWLAYALSLGQRVTDTRVCYRSGDRFGKLKTEYLGVDPGGDVRNEYVTPLLWVKPGTLTLEQFSIFRGGAGDARIQFTVRFDEHGKFHVISRKKIRERNE